MNSEGCIGLGGGMKKRGINRDASDSVEISMSRDVGTDCTFLRPFCTQEEK